MSLLHLADTDLSLTDWLQYFILKPTARRTKFLYLNLLNTMNPTDIVYSNHGLKDLGFTNNIKTCISYLIFKNEFYKDYFFSRTDITVPVILDITEILKALNQFKDQSFNWILSIFNNKVDLDILQNNTVESFDVGNKINDAVSMINLNNIITQIKTIITDTDIIEPIAPIKSFEYKVLKYQNLKVPLLNGLDIISKEILKYDLNLQDTETPIKIYVWSYNKNNIDYSQYQVLKYLTQFDNEYFTLYMYRPYFNLFYMKDKFYVSR
jgi:hypothetical protein